MICAIAPSKREILQSVRQRESKGRKIRTAQALESHGAPERDPGWISAIRAQRAASESRAQRPEFRSRALRMPSTTDDRDQALCGERTPSGMDIQRRVSAT